MVAIVAFAVGCKKKEGAKGPTGPTPPTVSAVTATTSGAGGGQIELSAEVLSTGLKSDGTPDVVSESGFCFAISPTVPTSSITDIITGGRYSAGKTKTGSPKQSGKYTLVYLLRFFLPKTTYNVRAYVINGAGTDYSPVFTETTL